MPQSHRDAERRLQSGEERAGFLDRGDLGMGDA
jgi:hypothetical protein